jgi:ADP-ribosyl-[dinitrogen reductase] hydrolase
MGTATGVAEMEEIRARARGAFVGLALGDALGASVEFMTRGEIRAIHGVHRDLTGGGWLKLAPGAVTDDTQMSLYLARSIVDRGGWFLESGAEYLAQWLKSRPQDVGNTVRRGLRGYITQGRLQTPPCSGDAGNGAAMRLLPVALATLGDAAEMKRCVLEQAHITHNHPLSDAACTTLGTLIHKAILGRSMTTLLQEVQSLVSDQPSFRFSPYSGMSSGYIVDTIQTVFHFFFRSRDFEECLIDTVNAGGDADTTGAIVGMLAGAYYGPSLHPSRWLRRMDQELLRELRKLATALVDCSPFARQGLASQAASQT